MMRIIKKIVGQSNDWKECTFYEVMWPTGLYNPNSRLNTQPLVLEWLRDNYGYPQYSVTWWKTVNSVWMRDDIYTHYKLCE